jgi:hypothetical protein
MMGFILAGLLAGALLGWYIGSKTVDRKQEQGICGATSDWCIDNIVDAVAGAVLGVAAGGIAAAVVTRSGNAGK